jgi:hypothetical protein
MTVNNPVIKLQTSDNKVFGINISTNNKVQLIYGNESSPGSSEFSTNVSSSLLDGNWHLLNITKYPSSYYYYNLYIDGVYIENKVLSISYSNNSVDMFIGKGFIGKMDNLRVYDRTLTSDEITEIYNAKQ